MFIFAIRTQNTSLLIHNSNISSYSLGHIHDNNVGGALRQALAYCMHLRAALKYTCARCCCGTARSCVVSTSTAIFSSLFDGCLEYRNEEKPKTGLRPGPPLNCEVKFGPKPGPGDVKKSGPLSHSVQFMEFFRTS